MLNAFATFLTHLKNIILNNLSCSIRTDRRGTASSRFSQFRKHT